MEITKPKFDILDAFARWWFASVGPIGFCPIKALSQVGPFTGVILYRDGPFQVQQWICPPNTEIPNHCHPVVDSLQIYMAGEIYLTLNGQPVIRPEDIRETADGVIRHGGFPLRVRPTDYHGGKIGPAGGVFLTIQHWLNGKPESVELNWDGDPIDDEHAKKLTPTYG